MQVWLTCTILCTPLLVLSILMPETQPAQVRLDNQSRKGVFTQPCLYQAIYGLTSGASGDMFSWNNLNPLRSVHHLWGSTLLRTLAIVLFLLQWSVDGFVDATLNYLVDRGFFGVAPATLVVWFAIQIIIGIMFWLPWFQKNLSRQNSLTVISAIIGLVSIAISFAMEKFKPWYPYAIGIIVSPIFVLLPLLFNWATEQIQNKDEAGEVIGALTAVRACSGILGALLPAGLAFVGHWCDDGNKDISSYYNTSCGGGPPKYLWNCIEFGIPWLIGAFASMVAILIIRLRLGGFESEQSDIGRDSHQTSQNNTRFSLLPGMLGPSRVHPSIIYGKSSSKEYMFTVASEMRTRHTTNVAIPSRNNDDDPSLHRSYTTMY